MRIESLVPVYLDNIPEELEEGKLYISNEYEVSIHLCACGCKQKTVLPFGSGPGKNWSLKTTNGLITFTPSVGNFAGEHPYHAHYFITNNKIIWC